MEMTGIPHYERLSRLLDRAENDDEARIVHIRPVREVFIVHVGGTRCVTSRTDNMMNIRARVTLTVEFIPTCIFIFLLYV
jgi:hypothetical protein